jgi:hypothetical protein
MKKSGLVILVIASFLNLEAANASGSKKSRIHEKLLTHNKAALEDPYYQIKKVNVRALTAEEELRYANEESLSDNEFLSSRRKLITKSFTGIVPGGVPTIPNIPPIPPEAGTIPGDVVPGKGPGGNIPPTIPSAPVSNGPLSGVIAIIDDLIAIGAKIIPTIDKGRAVVTNGPMSAVSVLPRIDTKDPVVHDMGNWSIPVSKHFQITYENGFGVEVISFVYSITFQHSGTYGGKGHYLAGIRLAARDINVTWGFDLDATSQLIQISNDGPENDVIAGATVEITYLVKNWTRTISSSKSFHVTGNGKIYKLD